MSRTKYVVLIWALLLAVAAVAGEQHARIPIAVDGSKPGAHSESQAQGHHEVRIIRKQEDVTN